MSQLKSYPKYKESGVEWLKKVPIDWGYTKLKRAAKVELGSIDKKSRDNEIDILLCNYVDVYYNDIITPGLNFMKATAKQSQIDKFKLRHDDVLITKDSETPDDIGVPTWVSHDMENVVCGYHLAQIRTSKKLVGKYLFYMLASTTLNKQLHSLANGVTRYGISKGDIENSLFLMPKIETQRKIIYFLDQKTSQIDALISDKERLMELLEEKRQAVITETVTKGLDPNVKMKDSGIEWIGEIPEHWGIERLKRISVVELSNVDKKTIQNEQSVFLCNYVDVYYNNIITSDLEFMKATAKTEQINKFNLRQGDVMLTKDSEDPNDIAVPAWVAEDMDLILCGYHLSHIRPNQMLNGKYLLYCLLSTTFKEQFHSLANGVTRYGLLKGDIKNSIINLPPLSEQIQIAKYLSALDENIDMLIKQIKRQISKLKEYREALIYEAVTGKIDVRDYAAEKEEVY